MSCLVDFSLIQRHLSIGEALKHQQIYYNKEVTEVLSVTHSDLALKEHKFAYEPWGVFASL